MDPPVPSADGPGAFPQPPPDAEQWTDEQWLDWLVATDPDNAEPGPGAPRPGRIASSRGGQFLGNAMLGVANALYGRKDADVVIVHEASGEPDDDEPIEVRLDPEHPERSEVIIRHDLRRRAGRGPERPPEPPRRSGRRGPG